MTSDERTPDAAGTDVGAVSDAPGSSAPDAASAPDREHARDHDHGPAHGHDHDHAQDDHESEHEHEHDHDHDHEHDDDHDDEDAQAKLAQRYQVEVTDVGPCRKRVVLTVAADEVRKTVMNQYAELGARVAEPGFRPGHAPRRLLEKRYAKAVLADVKSSLLNEGLEYALETHHLEAFRPPAESQFADVEVRLDADFRVVCELSVVPNFELPTYKGLKLEAAPITVDAAMVDKTVARLRHEEGVMVPIEGATIEDGDEFTADVALRDGDAVVASVENETVGSPREGEFESLFGLNLDGLAAAVRGKGAGDTVTFSLTAPEDHEDEALAGKELTVTVTVHEVKRPDIPPVDEAWLSAHDFDDLDELRADVEKQLCRALERGRDRALEHQAVEQLAAQLTFDLPQELIDEHRGEVTQRLMVDLMGEEGRRVEAAQAAGQDPGLSRSEEEHHSRLAQLRTQAEERFESERDAHLRALRVSVLMDKLADRERLFVTEDQIAGHLAAMSQAMRIPPEWLRRFTQEEGWMAQLRSSLRHDLVRKMLREQAEIVEMKA